MEHQRIHALKRLYDRFSSAGLLNPTQGLARRLTRTRTCATVGSRVFASGLLHRQRTAIASRLWPGRSLRIETIDQAIDRLAESFREAGRIAGDEGSSPRSKWNHRSSSTRNSTSCGSSTSISPVSRDNLDCRHFDLMTRSQGQAPRNAEADRRAGSRLRALHRLRRNDLRRRLASLALRDGRCGHSGAALARAAQGRSTSRAGS